MLGKGIVDGCGTCSLVEDVVLTGCQLDACGLSFSDLEPPRLRVCSKGVTTGRRSSALAQSILSADPDPCVIS